MPHPTSNDCTPAVADNPLLVGTYSFTATSAGTLDYTVAEGTANWGFVEIQFDQFQRVAFDHNQTSISVDSLTIVPAPAAAGTLIRTSKETTPNIVVAVIGRSLAC